MVNRTHMLTGNFFNAQNLNFVAYHNLSGDSYNEEKQPNRRRTNWQGQQQQFADIYEKGNAHIDP